MPHNPSRHTSPHTLAGRVLREIERNLRVAAQATEQENIALYQRALNQKRGDKNKLYSLHEPPIYCMSKGKEHKPYEFGIKAAITKIKSSNIIVGALAFDKNEHDSKLMTRILEQVQRLSDHTPTITLCDRGFRGVKTVDETDILIPQHKNKSANQEEQQNQSERFRKRAGIEPVIGHLKSDHRMDRNFLAGKRG